MRVHAESPLGEDQGKWWSSHQEKKTSHTVVAQYLLIAGVRSSRPSTDHVFVSEGLPVAMAHGPKASGLNRTVA
ncbi:MAG: hypothetical protein OSA08_07970 [Arenicellales bacterium]|nr:hypothetical protein [Arenicellales bacterium]